MRTLELLVITGLTVFATSAFAATDSCYPFTQTQGGISIPVTVAGVQSRAFFNTGIRTMGLSRALAGELGLEIEEVPPYRPRRGVPIPQSDRVNNVTVNVFDQDIETEQMYVFDRTESVVNMSLLMFSSLLVQIDYPQFQICFLKRGSIDLKDAANIKMRLDNTGAPAIEVTVNGNETLWLKLQIALQRGVSLDYLTARNLNFIDSDSDDARRSDVQLLKGAIENLQFGPFELANLPASFPSRATGNSQQSRSRTVGAKHGQRGIETRGQLGHEVLKHFIVTIDFQENLMHVSAP